MKKRKPKKMKLRGYALMGIHTAYSPRRWFVGDIKSTPIYTSKKAATIAKWAEERFGFEIKIVKVAVIEL